MKLNFHKHIEQIKKGGILVIVKKLRSFIYLVLQIPIYLISIPAIIIIRLIRPWFLLRWLGLKPNRIGHFAKETELYCCESDAKINSPSQKYINIFYLNNKYVCNRQLEKMWRRNLLILPAWLLIPLSRVNRFINIFLSGGNYHEIERPYVNMMRDTHSFLSQFQPHISFTVEEELKGKKILTESGIPEDAKFVCLSVRDSAYLDRHTETTLRNWEYHSFRDGDIDKYVLATEELTNRGYYILRTGVKVLKPLKSSNPKVIDYANSGIRSDFMDIYLGAKCSFCISTLTGFDEIPTIFRKPIVYISVVPFYSTFNIITHDEKILFTIKKHIHKKYKKELKISEIISSNVMQAISAEEFEENDIELQENNPEEIRDIVIEMDERLSGNWKETKEDLLLQKKFWSIYNKNIKRLNLKEPLIGKIKARFGAKYLRENQDWIK